MNQRKQSTRVFLVVTVNLIIVTLIFVSGLITVTEIKESLRESYLNQLNNIQKEISIGIENLYDESVRFSRMLAGEYYRLYSQGDVDYESLSRFFQEFHKAHGYIENIFISTAERDTEIIADSIGGASEGLKWRSPEFEKNIDASLKGEEFISDPAFSPQTGRVVQLFSVPVMDGNKPVAILGFALEIGIITQEKVEAVKIGSDGYPVLITKEGLTFAHKDPKHVMSLDISAMPFGPEMLKAKTGDLIEYVFQGDDKFASISRSDKYNYIILTTLKYSEINDHAMAVIEKMFIATIIGIVIAVSFILILMNNRFAPLKQAIHVSNEMRNGNLDVEVHFERRDEIGLVMESFRAMNLKLREVVSSILTGAEQIASASNELSIGNQDLSVRTEDQATVLEQTTTAIEEMNTSIRSNADNTTTANKLSVEVMEKASEGTSAVNEMIGAMGEISNSSERIADIIEVINNIAFQTNLLALNASIEAARAGEQGKGFAVVAVEVRKLAKRSDKAASEITDIIKQSNQKVAEGVNIANSAGDMLAEINEAVEKVHALIDEISAMSQNQLTSVDQIDRTFASLDSNTQKNAALVEEAAAATEELSAQAIELNRNMKFFTLRRK